MLPQRDVFTALFNRNPLPAWILGAASLDFLDVNPAALARYGYARDEFLRLDLRELLHSDVYESTLARLKGLDEGDLTLPCSEHYDKQGRAFAVIMEVSACMYADQRALLCQIQARSDERSRAQFQTLLRFSHDIKNPLSVILAYSDLLSRKATEGELESSRVVRHVEGIRRSAERIQDIVVDRLRDH